MYYGLLFENVCGIIPIILRKWSVVMKKIFALICMIVTLLALCACNKEVPATTAVPTTVPATTVTTGCVHQYKDADCATPKTCTLCGETRGEALGHDYVEGVCSRCADVDATFVTLTEGLWKTDAISEDGSQLENITLQFFEGSNAMLGAGIYQRLSDVPEGERDPSMENEENWYDYSGEIYYYAGYAVFNELSYSVAGNEITCTLTIDGEQAGTLILERTAGNMLSVTYYSGKFSIYFMQVGDVFTGSK